MRSSLRRPSLALAVAVSATACAERAQAPITAVPVTGASRSSTTVTSDVWKIAELDVAFPGQYSIDTTQVGNGARMYIAPDLEVDERPTFCRDHFEDAPLWWDGGDGLMLFELRPPLLSVGYLPGTVKSGVLTFRRAVYESIQSVEATDPAGNVWRFQGRFNALCRGGELEIGPIVLRGHALVPRDPINRPVLVRRGDLSWGCGGSSGGTELIEHVEYDPYNPMISASDDGSGSCAETGSGTQYEPGDSTGGETVDWGSGEGNGGTSVCGNQAMVEYACIDVYNYETGAWEEWSCGYVTTC